MPYIIDGVNLIGSCQEISLEDPQARSKLIVILKKYQESKKSNVIVVFDGTPENYVDSDELSSKFSVHYPPNDSTTHEEIIRILSRFHSFKDVVVVTSDRDLKSTAKKKGAKTINSIEFYFELKRISRLFGKEEESKKRIDAELSDREVDHWLKIFDR